MDKLHEVWEQYTEGCITLVEFLRWTIVHMEPADQLELMGQVLSPKS
jgi:hypothetical protein